MKKLLVILLILTMIMPSTVYALVPTNQSFQEETVLSEVEDQVVNGEGLIPSAKSGLLMEASTGTVLFEKEKDTKVSVASMTKMVLQIIVLEKVEAGKLKWDKVIKVSKNAAGMGGSQIYLQAGERMNIRDLFKGVSMASANDASVALAEEISGSEADFVKLMNKKVRELGLKNTKFKNCTGLDEEDHYSSAYDMAIIARELLKHEQILDYASVYEDYLRVNTPNKFWLVNTNKLVRFYEGADGLKTGHTDAAKYCLAATAKRNNIRLIAIVLGVDQGKIRNSETMELLDYGFQNFKMKIIKKQDTNMKIIHLDKADKEKINLVPSYDVGVLQNKNDTDKKYTYDIKVDTIVLPVKKGDIVGEIHVKEKNKVIQKVPLISNTTAKKISFPKLYLKILRETFVGEFY